MTNQNEDSIDDDINVSSSSTLSVKGMITHLQHFITITNFIEAKVIVPRSFEKLFKEMRIKFGGMFFDFRQAVKKQFSRSWQDVKDYLKDLFPHVNIRSINDVIEVIKRKCTLIDVQILDAIIKKFNVKGVAKHLEEYKHCIIDFQAKIKANICTQDTFEIVCGPSLLQCEMVVCVLNWKADETTLQDVVDVIADGFGNEFSLPIRAISEGNSIKIICSFVISQNDQLIVRANNNLEWWKQRGLLKLTIGYHTVYEVRFYIEM